MNCKSLRSDSQIRFVYFSAFVANTFVYFVFRAQSELIVPPAFFMLICMRLLENFEAKHPKGLNLIREFAHKQGQVKDFWKFHRLPWSRKNIIKAQVSSTNRWFCFYACFCINLFYLKPQRKSTNLLTCFMLAFSHVQIERLNFSSKILLVILKPFFDISCK